MRGRTAVVGEAEYRALAGLRHALRLFLGFSERAAREAGLQPQQHQALLAIRAAGPRAGLGVGELAEQLQVRHHSAVGLVDRLARAGLVRRARSPLDRRRVIVQLSGSGRRTLERLSAAHRDELGRVGPRLLALLRALLVRRRPSPAGHARPAARRPSRAPRRRG